MANLTFIGELMAQEGTEFTFQGPSNDCKGCKVKTVCLNLKKGKTYRVVSVRDKTNPCKVHEGKVVTVEIEEFVPGQLVQLEVID